MIYEFQKTIYQVITGNVYTRHSSEYMSEDTKHRLRMQLMHELKNDIINVITATSLDTDQKTSRISGHSFTDKEIFL